MATRKVDMAAEDTVNVILPSGTTWAVFPREVGFFNDKVSRYKHDFSFDNVSDLSELDRVVQMETLAQRYMIWAGDHEDYWHDAVNIGKINDDIKKLSVEIRLIKDALGIDKSTRDKISGDDSFESRWSELTQRAGEFALMRNEQFDRALEDFMELKALLTLHDNTTVEERKMLGCNLDDIWKKVREEFIPRFDAIDERFRKGSDSYEGQSMWVQRINR